VTCAYTRPRRPHLARGGGRLRRRAATAGEDVAQQVAHERRQQQPQDAAPARRHRAHDEAGRVCRLAVARTRPPRTTACRYLDSRTVAVCPLRFKYRFTWIRTLPNLIPHPSVAAKRRLRRLIYPAGARRPARLPLLFSLCGCADRRPSARSGGQAVWRPGRGTAIAQAGGGVVLRCDRPACARGARFG